MKPNIVMLLLASAVALSATNASARVYGHSHYRNSYNSMNMYREPAPAYGYSGPAYGYSGYSSGSSAGGGQLSGSAAESGGGAGGAPGGP